MGNRRFEMYEYRHILLRMRQGESDRDLARQKLMGRNKAKALRKLATEKGWLSPDQPLPEDGTIAQGLGRKKEAPTTSSVLPWENQIRLWVSQGIRGTTIYHTLRKNHGYSGSYSSVRRFIQSIPQDPAEIATVRLEFAPGEAAQIDFGAGPPILHPVKRTLAKTWFFVMTLCYSRHQYAELVFDQTVETWIGLHQRAFSWFGCVPHSLILDNPKCAIIKASYSDPVVQRSYAELTEGYSFRLNPCPPRDPAKKGRVEAGVKYIKMSFLPLRIFRNLEDANRQLHEWIMGEAGTRLHGTTHKRPLDLFNEVEKSLLKTLPDRPVLLPVWSKGKVYRHGHVLFEKNYYSVPYRLIGQDLWIRSTETMVSMFLDHELMATHVRLKGAGEQKSLPDHLPPNAKAWFTQDNEWCLARAREIGPSCTAVIETLLSDKVLIRLRAAQNIIGIAKSHTEKRLEAACERALQHNDLTYRTIKTILNKGLDMNPEPSPTGGEKTLPPAYSGKGRFARFAGPFFNWKENFS